MKKQKAKQSDSSLRVRDYTTLVTVGKVWKVGQVHLMDIVLGEPLLNYPGYLWWYEYLDFSVFHVNILSMIQKKTQNQDSRVPVRCGCCTPAVTQHSTAEHHCLLAWPHFALTPDMASYTTAR